jgi:HEAT repeat protein
VTGVTRAPEIDLAQMRQAAINPQASVEERLAALRALRTADARTPDVVQAMLQLEATSTDAKVRADIFRQLSGVRDPVLKPHLINGMLKDQDPKVREEAAETLGPFWSDPYVQSALKAAAQNDPDEKVRKQALESLEKKGSR